MKTQLILLAAALLALALCACSPQYTVLETITPAPTEDDSFIPVEGEEEESKDLLAEDAAESDFEEMPAYVPGTYRGEGDGYGGTIEVDVTVDEYSITSIDVVSEQEDHDVAGGALEEIPDAIMETQSADVDAVAGATRTSDAIVSAVMNALGLAIAQ